MSDANSFQLQPTLRGATITLRPLVAADAEALFAVASDPVLWAMHPDPLRYQREVFERSVFRGALASGSAFVVIDNASSAIVGSTRFYDYAPQDRDIAIGYTFLARAHWGDGSNREMKTLLLEHAFSALDAVWFHVGMANLRSCRAVEKLGATLIKQDSQLASGVPYQRACYRLSAAQWLALRAV